MKNTASSHLEIPCSYMAKKVNYQDILLQKLSELRENGQKPRLCLHACCGPCFTIPYEIIKDYFDITIIYNNSNIYPKEEHDRRLEEFKRYIKEIGAKLELVEFPYDNLTYNKDLEPRADDREGHERCRICFRKRLRQGFEYAKEHGFDYFGTVMTISRYKNHAFIGEAELSLLLAAVAFSVAQAEEFGMRLHVLCGGDVVVERVA